MYPKIVNLPDYKPDFPQYPVPDMQPLVPNMPPDGVALLMLMLKYDPAGRVSAKDAMEHPYFAELTQIGAGGGGGGGGGAGAAPMKK